MAEKVGERSPATKGGRASVSVGPSTKMRLEIPEGDPKDDKLDQSDPFQVPDGGTRAWSPQPIFCVYVFPIDGVVNTFGVFEEYYSANQLSDQSLNNISWIGSLQLCLVLLVGCISGPLCDAGYFKHLIAFGGLLYFFCLMMTSISTRNVLGLTEYYQFVLSQGLGVGLAQGLIFTPGMAVQAHHFKRYRTLVFGIFASGASIGGVILPIVLQRLFAQVGFGWGLVLGLVSYAVPQDFLLGEEAEWWTCESAIQSLSYSSLVLGGSFVGLGLYAPINFGVVYATQHGMSQRLAFYSLAILNAGSFVGRTLPNVIATLFGPSISSSDRILAFAVVFGIVSGAYVSFLPAAVASLTKNPNEHGNTLLKVTSRNDVLLVVVFLARQLTYTRGSDRYHWVVLAVMCFQRLNGDCGRWVYDYDEDFGSEGKELLEGLIVHWNLVDVDRDVFERGRSQIFARV
ncbi:hypothetical protein D9757_001067 [Collybiopsis confluens]|uniref:MFS general substrate transporter n=1 Tax=Collybiopsis confluens TaxID=2823264 RepID=A0A8H5I186_9AGAR|nr:hypothetical protein D9757_001067 [Collybiopsis confluens]